MESTVHWDHGLTFIGRGPGGHEIRMDTSVASGGDDSAGTPKELVLHALGGCTGMDVIMILQKMKLAPTVFAVHVSADLDPEPPRAFRSFHLDYRFEGENLPLHSLERAVVLSQEKYCSVSATLRPSHPISWSITVNGRTLMRKDPDVLPSLPPD
jgi:putative redox protein